MTTERPYPTRIPELVNVCVDAPDSSDPHRRVVARYNEKHGDLVLTALAKELGVTRRAVKATLGI